jgi:hypothetical protein
MPKQDFQFTFDGPEAQANAQALNAFLKTEFSDWSTQIAPVQPPPSAPDKRDAALFVAIIALIVALPSGIKDGIDLADRIQLKPRLDRLIAWAKERRAQRLRNPFVAVPPQNTPIPLDQAKPEQLLDAIAQSAKQKSSS